MPASNRPDVMDKLAKAGIEMFLKGPDEYEAYVQQALTEFEAAKKLNHPAIAKIYDCRLKNEASKSGQAALLRDWLASSDRRTVAAGKAAVAVLKCGVESGRLALNKKEVEWLERIDAALDALPPEEEPLIEEMAQAFEGQFDPASYGM